MGTVTRPAGVSLQVVMERGLRPPTLNGELGMGSAGKTPLACSNAKNG